MPAVNVTLIDGVMALAAARPQSASSTNSQSAHCKGGS